MNIEAGLGSSYDKHEKQKLQRNYSNQLNICLELRNSRKKKTENNVFL